MHRAFENVYKFVKTIAISIEKIMALTIYITLQLNFKALLRSYKLLSLAIFCELISLVYKQLCTVIT